MEQNKANQIETGSIAEVIATLMAGWNTIESAAKAQFPKASKEELYAICKEAMDHALKGGK